MLKPFYKDDNSIVISDRKGKAIADFYNVPAGILYCLNAPDDRFIRKWNAPREYTLYRVVDIYGNCEKFETVTLNPDNKPSNVPEKIS